MKILISAAAALFALTGTAYAQEAEEAAEMACCKKMQEEGKKCCCDHEGEGEHGTSGHNEGHTE